MWEDPLLWMGLFAFLWGSWEQFWDHRILASLRSSGVYGIPKGRLFELVSSPHYFAELVIYAAMFAVAVANHDRCVWVELVVLQMFVVANLTVTALKTHAWYHDKFREDYPRHRRALFPWVL